MVPGQHVLDSRTSRDNHSFDICPTPSVKSHSATKTNTNIKTSTMISKTNSTADRNMVTSYCCEYIDIVEFLDCMTLKAMAAADLPPTVAP